jgi:CheY-like chemotaxis protein
MKKINELRILIVEDEEYTLDLIEAMLRGLKVRSIYRAENGMVALGILGDPEMPLPDVIISDLNMPRMDGFSFVQRLRSIDNAFISRLPVIILTANSDVFAVRTGIKLGISGFLAKPVSAKLLESRILKALSAPEIDPNLVRKTV